MQLDIVHDKSHTEVGSYFVANYPPFSIWSAEHLPRAEGVLNEPASNGRPTPLGLYLHIPFCRKRCKFCYFRVYTDKNSEDVDVYMDALARETALYADRAALAGRQFDFVYFGGGTPSFLSSDQLQELIDRISKRWRWEHAREVTFECEPGTLKKSKLETIKAIGTTRLSLGVEHFDDDVLTLGGRAHKSPEIFRSYEWAREVGFAQINIDLIAGMVGDTDAKWRSAVEQAIKLEPDSVTIYQMEVPHNTVIAKEAKDAGEEMPVPSWALKRAWVDHAFREFEAAGYEVSSAYTLVKMHPPLNPPPRGGEAPRQGFVYRDALWHGADLIGMGVASFSHFDGVHFQNLDTWESYVGALQSGKLPLSRAWPTTDRQRLIRELILQLKLGRLDAGYFRRKFGVEVATVFGEALATLRNENQATMQGDELRLSREALLRVDALLPRFFEPEHRDIRYT